MHRALPFTPCLCLMLVLSAILPAPAGAQDGRTITAIEVEGLSSLSDETLLFYLGLEQGQTLDRDRLNESLREVWERGLLDDIRIETFEEEAGVRLKVVVEERPILRSIQYEGLKKISRSDVQDRIVRENIEVLERSPLSPGELERVKGAIESLYAEKGYRFAEARYTLNEVEPNEYEVIFEVDAGDRVRISKIRFDGNKVFRDVRLRSRMKKTRESGPISRILKRDIYNPSKLEEDLEVVAESYRKRGFKDVSIGEPVIEVKAKNPGAATVKKEKRRMSLGIPIDEGERWRLGEISIEGNEQYSDQQILRLFQHRTGNWLRSKKVEEGTESVTDLYENTGFMFSRVRPELRERGDNVADLIIHVVENDQFNVGRVEFEGNARTMDKVLRRELRVQEGYLMNMAALRNSVLKVNQLGYFTLNEEDPVEIDVDSDAKQVNLQFKGEESDRTELQFGGGWSESFGFEGQFSMRTSNFLGRGETLGVSFQSGEFRDLVDLSYFIPWFLDRPQTVGVRIFDQNFTFRQLSQDFTQEQRGTVLTYGRSLGLFQQLGVSYTFSDRTDLFNSVITDPITGETPPPIQLNRQFSSLRPVWTYDSRDSRFEATRGRRLSLSVEFAGGPLGGNSELIRPQLDFSIFKPLTRFPTRTILGLNIEGGYLKELEGNEPLSPFERFYLGGESSIRGHRVNSIFVLDEADMPVFDPNFAGVPLGGDTFLQINAEYHVLLGGPLRVLLFVDGGNVWGGDQSIDLSNLRLTTGVEFRVLVPVFGAPLRFIYSKNLNPIPAIDDFEQFQFTLGSSF